MLHIMTNVKKSFADWLEQTFLNWQAKNGQRASLREFAEYLGYSRPLISMWLAGQRLPSDDGIKRLAELFGLEIYDVLEIPRPDPHLQRLEQIWSSLSDKERKALRDEGENYYVSREKKPKRSGS